MSVSKEVGVVVHDHTGAVLGVFLTKPKAAMWRATGRGPWVNIGGAHLKSYIVGSGREAELHVRLPAGAPTPKKLLPQKPAQ